MIRRPLSVTFVLPQGTPGVVAHHEAVSGMGDMAHGTRPFVYAPLTVAACAAVTREAGIATTVLDPYGSNLGIAETMAKIGDAAPDVIAVLVSEGTSIADGNFLRLLRASSRKDGRRHAALLFGPSASYVAQRWLEDDLAEGAIAGEPEGAIAEAVARTADGALRGLVSGGDLVPGPYIHSHWMADGDSGLDLLPFPAWDIADWQPYGAPGLLSSRGCSMGCGYCGYVVSQGQRPRAQSPDRTLAEWAWLYEHVRPACLLLRDPVFARDRERVLAICEGISRRGMQIPWQCESRPDHFDDELLAMMKRAGCVSIKIGLESADPATLVGLGRIADAAAGSEYLARAHDVAAACRKLALHCRVFVMAGLPPNVQGDLSATYDFLGRLPRGTTIHAKRYGVHPGIALSGQGTEVTPEVLSWLEGANSPRRPFWRRVLARVRRSAGRAVRTVRHNGAPPQPLSPEPCMGEARAEALVALRGQRVFVTGGNGFLGGHVARALAAAGAQVVALVRPGSALGALADLPVELVRGELAGVTAWASALEGCVYCFHLAALHAGSDQADSMYATNAAGGSALAAACAANGVRRFIHTGTVGTVGQSTGHGRLPDENTPFDLWDFASHYVRSKRLGEAVAESWQGMGLEVVIVKPTAPVGSGDDRPTATGRRILAALRGEYVAYPPGGVNYIPVKDAAMGHLLAAQLGVPGRTYILGHHAGNLDYTGFIRMIARVSGVEAPPLRSGAQGPMAGPPGLVADPSRAIRELGLPQSDLREAFAAAVNHYRSSGAWKDGH